MRRKWSRLLGISLTSALAVSCATGADDAASQGGEDDDIVAGKSEELAAGERSSAESLARVALRETKISKTFSTNVRRVLAAGRGHDLIVKLNVPASLKGAERLAAIKAAQEKMRSAFGHGVEIKQTLAQVPYALVHVKSEAALDQLLEHEGVAKLHEDAKLVPMTVGVKTPAETAAYLNQTSAATSLGVAVSSLGSHSVSQTCSAGDLGLGNVSFEDGTTSGWNVMSGSFSAIDGSTLSPAIAAADGNFFLTINNVSPGSAIEMTITPSIDSTLDYHVSVDLGDSGLSTAPLVAPYDVQLVAVDTANGNTETVLSSTTGVITDNGDGSADWRTIPFVLQADTHVGQELRLRIIQTGSTGSNEWFNIDNATAYTEPTAGCSTTVPTGVVVLDSAMDPTEVDSNCTDIDTGNDCRVVSFTNLSGSVDEYTDHAVVSGAVVHAMAPGAEIHNIQVTNAGLASESAVAAALSSVLSDVSGSNPDNIKVVSLSYGSLDAYAIGSDACAAADSAGIADLITQLRDAGVLVVAPTGNGGNTKGVSFPACLSNAVSVASATSFSGLDSVLDVTNSDDTDSPTCTITSSNEDKVLCNANSVSGVTLLAPGFQVDADGAAGPITAQSGTSIAAAHVAGALAVMNAAFANDAPAETIERALNRLKAGGKKITDTRNGAIIPRVNLLASIADCVGAVASETSLTFAASGATINDDPASQTVTFETDDACTPSNTQSSFLTVTPGTTDITVAASNNAGGAARKGTVTAFGVSISVSQDGDTTVPVATTPVITGANGAFPATSGYTAARAVKVTALATDNQDSGTPSQTCLMNQDSGTPSTCTGQWLAYSSTPRSHTLSDGDGAKTVWAFHKDAQGNLSAPVSASVILDTVSPTVGTIDSVVRNAAPVGATFSISGMSDDQALSSILVVHGATSTPTKCTGSTDSSSSVPSASSWSGTGTVDVTGVAAGSYQFRVCAVDLAGNASTGVTSTVQITDDLTAPVGVNAASSGAPSLGVAFNTSTTMLRDSTTGAYVTGSASGHTVALAAQDDKASGDGLGAVTQICVGTSNPCTTFTPATTPAANFSQNVSVTLTSGTGNRTIYAAFKDAGGNTSDTYPVSVLLDQTAPSNGTLTTARINSGVALTISNASDNDQSGIAALVVARGTGSAPANCSAGTAIPVSAGSTYTVNDTGLTNGSVYYYRVCTRDLVGNTSTGVTAGPITIKNDTYAPTGSATIDGADYADANALPLDVPGFSNGTGALLQLTFDDQDSTGAAVVPRLCLSTGALDTTDTCPATAVTGDWITLTPTDATNTGATYALTLAAGEGTKTYNYKFRDDATGGYNVSAVKSASIRVDTKAPSQAALTVTAVADYKANLSWLGITDNVAIDHYTVVYNESTTAAPTAPATADCTDGTVLDNTLTTRTFTDPGTGITVPTYRAYRVCAFDKAGAAGDPSHIVSATGSAFLRSEVTAPTFSNMSVLTMLTDGGKNWTNSLHPDVTITVTDDHYDGGQICINSRDSISNCVWQPLAAGTSGVAQTYTPMNHLGGTAQRKYYAFAKDALGNTSPVPSKASSTVSFWSDRTPPYPGTIRSTATNSSVTLTWTAPKEYGVGLPTSNVYTLFYVEGTSTGNASTVPGCTATTITKQVTLGTSASLATATHTGLKANTYYRYSLCFVDKLGNINRVIRTQKTAK